MKSYDDWLLEGSGVDHEDEIQEYADKHGMTYSDAEYELRMMREEDEAERRAEDDYMTRLGW